MARQRRPYRASSSSASSARGRSRSTPGRGRTPRTVTSRKGGGSARSRCLSASSRVLAMNALTLTPRADASRRTCLASWSSREMVVRMVKRITSTHHRINSCCASSRKHRAIVRAQALAQQPFQLHLIKRHRTSPARHDSRKDPRRRNLRSGRRARLPRSCTDPFLRRGRRLSSLPPAHRPACTPCGRSIATINQWPCRRSDKPDGEDPQGHQAFQSECGASGGSVNGAHPGVSDHGIDRPPNGVSSARAGRAARARYTTNGGWSGEELRLLIGRDHPTRRKPTEAK